MATTSGIFHLFLVLSCLIITVHPSIKFQWADFLFIMVQKTGYFLHSWNHNNGTSLSFSFLLQVEEKQSPCLNNNHHLSGLTVWWAFWSDYIALRQLNPRELLHSRVLTPLRLSACLPEAAAAHNKYGGGHLEHLVSFSLYNTQYPHHQECRRRRRRRKIMTCSWRCTEYYKM